MKYMSIIMLTALLGIFGSCSKNSNGPAVEPVPTNLNVTASVNPDNSGNVNFTATATNAKTYEYDFGNGVYQNSTSGALTYKYPTAGTYSVNVSAKNNSGQKITKSISVVITITSTLVWSDEFNGNGAPDPAKWGYDIGNNNGWGNSELEYYTNRPENVVQSGGTLKINAIRENFSGYTFTSARILSKGKFDMKYGKVEISAKIPGQVGSWPALWMLGSNIDNTPWPNCGEIDIMEYRGFEPNKIFGTLHYPGHSGGNADGATTIISNATTAFHKYGLEWNAQTIKISVDDVVFKTFQNSAAVPFNHNFFFIMNVAMGGTFAGPVDASVNGATMEVDYIRVYSN